MLEGKIRLVAGSLALALAGCGGGGGLDATATDADLRLASETATTKPYDGETSTGTTTTSTTAPTKTSTSTTASLSTSVAPYDPTVLPVIGGEPTASASWPTWRKSMSRWEWRQLPGSDLSSIAPNPSVPGSLRTRIDAWNGLAADTRNGRLYSAANGGHADYSGNEVYEIDVSAESPSWRMLRAPTPTADILKSDYTIGAYYDYYRDGRPSSTHTYYALQFIASRNAIFKFGAGSLWGSGNENNWKTDAFSLAENDWHPAGTWPDVYPTRGGAIGAATCKDPVTEEVYKAAPGNLRRFDPATGTYTVLAPWPDNHSAVTARACAVDPARKQVVFFGDAYRMPLGGLRYDIATNSFSRIAFSGDVAAEVTAKTYNYAWYEAKIGRFLLKSAVGDRVYSIDPNSFEAIRVPTAGGSTMPDAVNGVQTRWQRLPSLGGYAYYPRSGSGVWFLAVE